MQKLAWTKSIRFKVAFWYTFTVAIVLVLAGTLIYQGARTALTRETDEALGAASKRLVEYQPVSDAIRSGNQARVQAALADEIAHMAPTTFLGRATHGWIISTLFVRLGRVSTNETIAASSSMPANPELLRSMSTINVRVPDRRLFDFLRHTEDTEVRCLSFEIRDMDCQLQVAVPWGRTEYLLRLMLLAIVVTVILFLIISALGSWTLVGRTLRPIDALVTEAELLTADHLTHVKLNTHSHSDDEVAHLANAINRMLTRLRGAIDTMRHFTADASHELRTPLSILQGEIELALTRERTPREYEKTLQSSLVEVQRMTKIVDSLSVLSRLDARTANEGSAYFFDRKADGDLSEVTLRVIDAVKRRADTAGILIEARLDPFAWVKCDEDSLHRIVLNLVDNALRYTPAGGQVSLTVRIGESECRLVVLDNGVGIAPEDLPHIFVRFYRADKARVRTGGSGLGLAIVQGIVKASGGTIDVESRSGQGTRFTIRLPRSTSSPESEVDPASDLPDLAE